MNAIIPIPPTAVSIRDAVSGDVPFIDTLQKLHSKQVGFMRTSWIEAKIAKGEVLVAENVTGHSSLVTGLGEMPAPTLSLSSDKGQVTSDK